ncbi:hypothetical protein M8J77_005498 [Diaphorina citri]|nr:hypothetical protein M8J77_005498 [Diaphorina citri]
MKNKGLKNNDPRRVSDGVKNTQRSRIRSVSRARQDRTDYQELKDQKQINDDLEKRILELESDCSGMNEKIRQDKLYIQNLVSEYDVQINYYNNLVKQKDDAIKGLVKQVNELVGKRSEEKETLKEAEEQRDELRRILQDEREENKITLAALKKTIEQMKSSEGRRESKNSNKDNSQLDESELRYISPEVIIDAPSNDVTFSQAPVARNKQSLNVTSIIEEIQNADQSYYQELVGMHNKLPAGQPNLVHHHSVDIFEETISPSLPVLTCSQEISTSNLGGGVQNEQVNQSKVHTVGENIYLVGDSIAASIKNIFTEKCPTDKHIIDLTRGGATIGSVNNTFQMEVSKDDMAVLIIGTNDLFRTKWDEIKTGFESMLNKLQNCNKVFIVQICRRYDTHRINKHITKLNTRIKHLVKTWSNVTILHTKYIKYNSISEDGVHLNNTGKNMLVHRIVSALFTDNQIKISTESPRNVDVLRNRRNNVHFNRKRNRGFASNYHFKKRQRRNNNQWSSNKLVSPYNGTRTYEKNCEEPNYRQPVYQSPINEPGYRQPMRLPPINEPSYRQPMFQPPVNGPMYQPPINEPMYRSPIDEPGYRQPMNLPPINGPMNLPPINERMYRPPIKEPRYRQPMNLPPINELMYHPPINEPMCGPLINEPMYRPPINEPMYRPPINEPMYRPPINEPMYRPPINDPMYRPPINEPMYRPPINEPMYRPPINEPMYRPSISEPMYRPPINDPMYRPPIGEPRYLPPINDPAHRMPMNQSGERQPAIHVNDKCGRCPGLKRSVHINVERGCPLLEEDGHHPTLEISVGYRKSGRGGRAHKLGRRNKPSNKPNDTGNITHTSIFDDKSFIFNSDVNFGEIDNNLKNANWTPIFETSDVNEVVTIFYKTLYNELSKTVPIRKISNNRTKATSKKCFPSWWNKTLITVYKEKEKARKNRKVDSKSIVEMRKKCKKMIKTTFQNYLSEIENDIKKNPKNFYEFIKSRSSPARSKSFLVDGDLVTDPEVICNSFAATFESVYNETPSDYMCDFSQLDVCSELKISEISENDIQESIKKLPEKAPVQGSKLSGLLFAVLIDGIGGYVRHSKYLLYADDFKLYRVISNESESRLLQEDLSAVDTWLKEIQLQFSIKKCDVMTITTKRSRSIYSYKINDSVINRVESKKDLGVTFQNTLKFDQHITEIAKKAYRSLGLVVRHSYFFSSIDTVRLLYTSLVRSNLEYASVIWAPQAQWIYPNVMDFRLC